MLRSVPLCRVAETTFGLGLNNFRLLNDWAAKYRRHAVECRIRAARLYLLHERVGRFRLGSLLPSLDEAPRKLLELPAGTRHREAFRVDNTLALAIVL